MSMTPEELEEVYTDLCNRLTAVGEDRLADGLARVTLVLMNEVGDHERLRELITDALSDIPVLDDQEGPWKSATQQ